MPLRTPIDHIEEVKETLDAERHGATETNYADAQKAAHEREFSVDLDLPEDSQADLDYVGKPDGSLSELPRDGSDQGPLSDVEDQANRDELNALIKRRERGHRNAYL
ncbi:hypothetical protein MMC07_007640 [Pseudocyphellaria aurata]|nr:hypothetical protein [Pseudocyphellaria aurata]